MEDPTRVGFIWCSNDANDANNKSQNIRIENLRSDLLIHLHPVKKVTHSIHWYISTSSYIQDQSSHWHYEQSWTIMATAIWNHLLCGDSMIVPIETMDVSWGIDHTPFTYRGQSTLQQPKATTHNWISIPWIHPPTNHWIFNPSSHHPSSHGPISSNNHPLIIH